MLAVGSVFLVLLVIGAPIAFAIGLAGFVFFVNSDVMPLTIGVQKIASVSQSFPLLAVPFFVFAGHLMNESGITDRLFKFANVTVSWMAGGLAQVSIIMSTLMGGVSGSAVADAAMEARVLGPSMIANGYSKGYTAAVIALSSLITATIPPSIGLILYGYVGDVSIGRLFMAGIVPGLVLALMFMAYVMLVSKFSKTYRPDAEPVTRFVDKVRNSLYLIPVLVLIFFVIGSMYGGWATATEAAAIGVVGALILAAVQGSLNLSTFIDSLMGAMRTSAMIALILAGASFLSLSMGFTGLPRDLAEWIGSLGLSKFQLLMALLVFYIVIGCFLDGISSVVLTIAVVEPMVRQAGIDIIWFGIFIVVVVEMAQITPPIGFNLFVMQGMTGHEMNFIARAAFPMFLIMVVMVFVLIAFPELATWLPANIRQTAGG